MSSQDEPLFPKLRPLDVRPILHQGEPFFLLRDPLGLTGNQVLVPQALGTLLSLCDGTRDIPALSTAFLLKTGTTLLAGHVEQIIHRLGEALLLEDHRFAQAVAAAEEEYRSAPFRPPALAGKVYPEEPAALEETFREYCRQAGDWADSPGSDSVVGVVSPHIDYQRGGPVYAGVWRQAASAIRDVDLVVVFGTDHSGGPGKLTLTRQDYATPWGILPTCQPIVERLAQELGTEAFEEELHHKDEHSIELALVWLHYFLRPRSCEVVPILCGSFQSFVEGKADPTTYEPFEAALRVLGEEAADRHVLVVASADLAHVGPVFGDPTPYAPAQRQGLRSADDALLAAIGEGDPHRFFDHIQSERDQRRICGMPPIYLALRMLDPAVGETTGYDQCPADVDGGSLVSIAGALLRRPAP